MFGQVRVTMLRLGMRTRSIFNSQLVATRCNWIQQGGQARATCCAQQCCDLLRLNVAIVWPELNSAISFTVAKKIFSILRQPFLPRCLNIVIFTVVQENPGNNKDIEDLQVLHEGQVVFFGK